MKYNEEHIHTLIVQAQWGSIFAFEELVVMYERGIFSYMYKNVSHIQDAEDLTQETFIRLYKNLKSIDLQKNFKAWLYKIAINVMYDWFRKKKRRRELFIIDDDVHQFETIDEKDAYCIAENTRALEDALYRLREGHRQILVLFYYQGFTYEEIADALALPLNTVKTNLRRAKQALGDILKTTYA